MAEVARDEWLAIEDGPLESVAIGEKVKMKLNYGGVAGEIVGEVMELTVDALGKLAGVDIRGTTLPALRHWKVSRGGAAGRLFCCRTIVEPEKQVLEEGIGYPSEVMIFGGEQRWMGPELQGRGPDRRGAGRECRFESAGRGPWVPSGRWRSASSCKGRRRGSSEEVRGQEGGRRGGGREGIKELQEKAGEGYDPEGNLGSERDAAGPQVQERDQGLPAEAKAGGFKLSDFEQRIERLLWRDRPRAGTEGRIQEAARIPHTEGGAGGSSLLKPECGGGVERVSTLCALLPSSRATERRIEASATRDADDRNGPGQPDRGERVGHSRPPEPAPEEFGVAAGWSGWRGRQAVGAGAPRGNDLSFSRGEPFCSLGAFGRAEGEKGLGEAGVSAVESQGEPQGRRPHYLEGPGEGRKGQRKGEGKGDEGQEGGGVQGGCSGVGLLREAPPAGEDMDYATTGQEVRPPFAGPAGETLPVEVAAAAQAAAVSSKITESQAAGAMAPESQAKKSLAFLGVEMLGILPSVLGRVSRKTVRDGTEDVFPLPSPLDQWDQSDSLLNAWAEGVVRSLNWMAGVGLVAPRAVPSREQAILLGELKQSFELLPLWNKFDVSGLDPVELFNLKQVNSYGEEVHVARTVRWENVSESLPKAGVAGIVPAADVCEGGFREYILFPEKWLKPESDRAYIKPPRVMIPEEAWEEVARGLLGRGICGRMRMEEALHVSGQPVLGGLFGNPRMKPQQKGLTSCD